MRLHRLIVLLLLAACDGDPSGIGADDVRLEAAVDESAPPPEVNVEFQVQNPGARTVYVIDHCGDAVTPALERRQGGEWVLISIGAPCFAMVTPPVELEPGDAAAGARAVHEPGEYRMWVRVAASMDADVDELETVYGEFTIGS